MTRRAKGRTLAADQLPEMPLLPEPGVLRVLMIGDAIGKPGRQTLERELHGVRQERGIDFVTVNGENVAGGMGLTMSTAEAIFDAGADVITSGNHIWDKRELIPQLDGEPRILRPLNYGAVPGHGWGTYHAADGTEVAVDQRPGPEHDDPHREPVHGDG